MTTCGFCLDDPKSLRRVGSEWVHEFPGPDDLVYTAPCTAPCLCNEDRDCSYCDLKYKVRSANSPGRGEEGK